MFVKLIKEYRFLTNKTQAEMASMLSISTNHLSRLERGLSYPSGELITRIIDIISNDPDIIIKGTQDEELYGLIIMISFENLDSVEKGLIFHEVMRLIKLSKKYDDK